MVNVPRWKKLEEGLQIIRREDKPPGIVNWVEGRFRMLAVWWHPEGEKQRDYYSLRIVDDAGENHDFLYWHTHQEGEELWARVLSNCSAADLCRVRARINLYSDESYDAPTYLGRVHRRDSELETIPYPEAA